MSESILRFAVIADTHTRPAEGDQSSPWEVNTLANARARYVVARVNQMRPSFSIHLGDVVHPVPALPTYDAAAEVASDIMGTLEHEYFYIPGNHDVGDKPFPANPAGMVNEQGLAAYQRHFGPLHHSFSHQGCRFILINSPVMNSGLAAEQEQRTWLEEELEAGHDERVFLFTHYPPFVCHRDEPSNYDNIDEPARSWLLQLIERHQVEALFAGHVHNFFYHRIGATDCYLLPATSFFRQDYAELFRVEAADQFGRNDAAKLGFCTVEVMRTGHIAHIWRSDGQQLEHGEALSAPPLVAGLHPKLAARAPLGVHLRHPWAEITALPYNGPMDEFQRKQARNDYTLLTLWELGVRKLRVPLSDLLDDTVRARMKALLDMGHRFTVFCFRLPSAAQLQAMVQHASLVEAFEFIIPWHEAASMVAPLAQLRRQSGTPIQLSKMESSAERKEEGSKFSHFVSYGFRVHDLELVQSFLSLPDARNAIDAAVFRVGLDTELWRDVLNLDTQLIPLGIGGVVNVRLASDNPAECNDDDSGIAMRVAHALCAAHLAQRCEVFLDTYMDLDRGYFPRHGLFDRRFNPRPAAHVYRHLQAVLGRLDSPHTLDVATATGTINFRAGDEHFQLCRRHDLHRVNAVDGTRCQGLIAGEECLLASDEGAAFAANIELGEEPVLLRSPLV